MSTAQGPQVLCFRDSRSSLRYRGGTCAICTGQASAYNNYMHLRIILTCQSCASNHDKIY